MAEECSRSSSGLVTQDRNEAVMLGVACWHTTSRLAVPKNIWLIFLPSRSPELHPVENL